MTTTVEILETAPGRFAIRGALTFRTARRARELAIRALAATDAREIEVDCGGVAGADSAGLAVLLDWLAEAQRAGRALRFTRLPPEIRAVARISEVEELLDRGVTPRAA